MRPTSQRSDFVESLARLMCSYEGYDPDQLVADMTAAEPGPFGSYLGPYPVRMAWQMYMPVAETLAGWAARNGCRAEARRTELPARAGIADGTRVVRHDYVGCVPGGALQHLEVVGNGHCWPDGCIRRTLLRHRPGVRAER